MGYVGDVPLALGSDSMSYREQVAMHWLKKNRLFCSDPSKISEDDETHSESQEEEKQAAPPMKLTRGSKTVEHINEIKDRMQRNSQLLGKVVKEMKDSLRHSSS